MNSKKCVMLGNVITHIKPMKNHITFAWLSFDGSTAEEVNNVVPPDQRP